MHVVQTSASVLSQDSIATVVTQTVYQYLLGESRGGRRRLMLTVEGFDFFNLTRTPIMQALVKLYEYVMHSTYLWISVIYLKHKKSANEVNGEMRAINGDMPLYDSHVFPENVVQITYTASRSVLSQDSLAAAVTQNTTRLRKYTSFGILLLSAYSNAVPLCTWFKRLLRRFFLRTV
nr:hypothetical protein [Tanacetum cinerariifolium]